MTQNYPSCYNSRKQYEEAMAKEVQLRKEIQNSVIANAPTEEVREAIKEAIKKTNK